MMRFLAAPAALLAVMAAAVPPAGPAVTPGKRAFNGVTCPRATSCWAVGDETASGVTRTLIEHWNGAKWSLTVSPSVPGSSDTFLSGVSCSARPDCWAVGSAAIGSAKQEPIAEHWNGRKWSLAVLPEPAGLATDVLFGVWCPAATRCWAVGSAAPKQGVPSRPMAEHWTGKKWSVVATRAAGGLNLTGVFCRRDTDCWAVGAGDLGGLAEHWNGRRWSAAATPSTGGGLAGVWCPGRDCFATGDSGFPSAIAERWNGRKWSLTPTAPLRPGTLSILTGVSCATPTNCVAVGNGNVQTLAEAWRGSKWVKVKSPNPAGAKAAELRAVFCLSLAACWAVGGSTKQQATSPDSTLAEHWNGTRWSIVPTP
jgi:hypothetical protein